MPAVKPCLFYKVQLAQTGEPLVGTMQGYPNAKISDPCAQALVPNYQVPVTEECRPASGLRYFYKVDRNGKIVPNSMWSATKKPKSMCSGQHSVLEFIVTKPSNHTNP